MCYIYINMYNRYVICMIYMTHIHDTYGAYLYLCTTDVLYIHIYMYNKYVVCMIYMTHIQPIAFGVSFLHSQISIDNLVL